MEHHLQQVFLVAAQGLFQGGLAGIALGRILDGGNLRLRLGNFALEPLLALLKLGQRHAGVDPARLRHSEGVELLSPRGTRSERQCGNQGRETDGTSTPLEGTDA